MRGALFEEQARHSAIDLRSPPTVAPRLHHGCDLGEPFDSLTRFEDAPEDAPQFEELVAMARRTEAGRYVEREVDLRLIWAGLTPSSARIAQRASRNAYRLFAR
jgi:hypothetical protein